MEEWKYWARAFGLEEVIGVSWGDGTEFEVDESSRLDTGYFLDGFEDEKERFGEDWEVGRVQEEEEEDEEVVAAAMDFFAWFLTRMDVEDVGSIIWLKLSF